MVLIFTVKENRGKEDAEPKNVEPIHDSIMCVSPTMDAKPIQWFVIILQK